MKSYFTTLGYTEQFVLRLLAETSASPDDPFVIVVPSPITSSTRTALENLNAFCSRANYPPPKVVEVAFDSLESLLSSVLDALLPLPEPVITDLTVGMRLFDVAILLALVSSRKRFVAYLREIGQGRGIRSARSSSAPGPSS
ncbi:MAG: CRISPR-associated CARF protein Csa3 [Thermoprotei archaeon]